jgi:N-acetylneuraminic acid mutarotase
VRSPRRSLQPPTLIDGTESFQWSHPEMSGELPPPCRAHTSTLVDRKLVVYGGGQGAHYYSDVFVLDTLARRWARADFGGGTVPAPRRAHTAEHYRGRIYVFGGGNGTEAVNDVWALDVGAHALPDRMRWDKLDVRGPRPCARGYHTANVVGDVMIIIGGSDGKECFMDVWCLHLGARRARTARTRG